MGKRIFFLSVIFFLSCYAQAQSWQKLGVGSHALSAKGTITAICVDTGNIVYAGGDFTNSSAYPEEKFYVAKWDGNSWSHVGYPSDSIIANGDISTMYVDATHNLYVAGIFKDASGMCFVAKWDGTVWSEVGIGAHALNANNSIQSICEDGTGN
jgi:hypothetical protein